MWLSVAGTKSGEDCAARPRQNLQLPSALAMVESFVYRPDQDSLEQQQLYPRYHDDTEPESQSRKQQYYSDTS